MERKMEAAREITVGCSSKEIEMKEEEKKPKRGKCRSLCDDKLWEGFEKEGIDRILRGEITPKNLIITFPILPHHKERNLARGYAHYLQRGPWIVNELLSVFPNSKTIEWETYMPLQEIFPLAKRMGFTSLVLCRCDFFGHDEMHIISLVNGAFASFRLFDLIPMDPALLPPNSGNPTTNVVHPQLCMERFKSPASVGTARMIQSLFPKVSVPPPRRKSIVYFKNHKGRVYFRHHRFRSVKALPGEERVIPEECRPEFSLMLTGVMKISFNNDTRRMNLKWFGRDSHL